jgi:hypothetical protein
METTQNNTESIYLETLRAIIHDVNERQKETARQIKESATRLNKQIGKLNNCFGEMVKNMVMPDMVSKFSELGLVFTQAYSHTVIYDEEYNILTEVDITLENGDKVMIAELKLKPNTKDIADHVKRMEMLRLHADLHGDKRKYLGTIVGMLFDKEEKQYALKNGFYVVEPCVVESCEETFTITEPSGDCSPKEW